MTSEDVHESICYMSCVKKKKVFASWRNINKGITSLWRHWTNDLLSLLSHNKWCQTRIAWWENKDYQFAAMISLGTPFRFHIYCSLTPIWKPSSITTTCNSRELANEHPNRRDTLGKGPKVRQRAESQMLSEPKSHCSTQNFQATTFPNQPTCRKIFITQSRCDWSKQKSSSLGEYTSCISDIYMYIYI